MLNSLIRWSLGNRLAVLIVSALLLFGGGFVTTRMPVDVFPDLTAPTVVILVEGHGMAPEEMETLVTFPIETAVNGATNVRRVRSATSVGIVVVWVEFDWGTDVFRARQTVTERLAGLTGTLPAQVEAPVLAPITSIMGEIVFVSLTSDRHDLLELGTVVTTDVRRRLLSVAGVSQVTPIGGDTKQYEVILSPQRLRAFAISVESVADAIRQANENVSAGFLVRGGQESIIQGIGRIRSLEDIGQTVVTVRGDTPIKVNDLGAVDIGAAIKRGVGSASRRGPRWKPVTEPGVILAIQKMPDANTLALTQDVDAALDEIQDSLPEGMLINKQLFRQANFIQVSIRNTIHALRDGAIMVVLVVVVFLASFSASVITLLAIPISLVIAVLTLEFFGSTINTMTLGGMAIAIGSLVDDAIIDVENIIRRLRDNAALPESQRHPAIEIVFKASVEVRASIVFATLIILLVFVPLFFLSGIEGRLLRPLGVAFTVSLAASLLTALTLTPALSYYLLPRSRTIATGHEPWVVRALKRLYTGPLDWALRHPWLVLTPTVVLFVASIIGASFLGRSFLPEFNEGAIVIGAVTVPGTSLDQSDSMARLVETTLMQHPEIVAIGRRTGRAEENEHVQGPEATEFELTLDMNAPLAVGKPRRTKAELLEALRHDTASIPGIQATFGQPVSHRIDHMLSGTRANIAIKIFGQDLHTLRALADRAEDVIRDIPGVVDLSTEQQTDIPLLRVDLDRPAIARYGLRARDVARALETGHRGRIVTQVLEGRIAFNLVVRVADSPEHDAWTRTSPAQVGDLLVDTPNGIKIPLKALARISEEVGPNMISRENAERRIVVQCNVANRDLGSVVADIRQAVANQVDLPSGYYVRYGGQFESARETRRRLGVLGLVVVCGIGLLLHIVFRSMRDSLLIMVNLPFALIGGVAGVALSGGVLSVASIIGFISVFGIAARNGIMMISHIRHLQRFEGVTDFRGAVRRGALERLAPILMTALATGLALIPLALGADEPGKEILTPMANVILYGLLSATFLNMIVVPALFLRFGRPTEAEPEPDVGPDLVQMEHALPAAPM